MWRVDEERPIGENELVRHKTRVGSPRGKAEGGQSFAGGLAVSFLHPTLPLLTSSDAVELLDEGYRLRTFSLFNLLPHDQLLGCFTCPRGPG